MNTRALLLCGALACAIGTASAAVDVVQTTVGNGLRARLTTFSEPGNHLELRGLALSTDARARPLLLVASRPEDANAAPANRLLAMTADPARDDTWRSAATRLPGLDGDAAAESPLVGAFVAIDEEGRASVLSTVGGGALQLTRLAPDGSPQASLAVEQGGPSVELRQFRASGARGRFLIAGSAGSVPWVAEIDANGKLVWQQRLPDLADAAAVALLRQADGGAWVLVERGSYNDPASVLLRIDAAGRVAQRIERAGRPVDLAQGTGGQLVMLVDRPTVATRELLALAFEANGQLVWQKSLVNERGLLGQFRMAALPDGRLLVAGRQDRGLWLTALNGQGQVLWTQWTDPRTRADLELVSRLDMVVRGRQVLVGYSAMVAADRRQRGVVRALQFTVE